ncbi:putative zinc-binding protein [Paratrimastix pyriformis]|uniref:Zinc-binding protein n=1 Tax=Paratrimastix pyriformis TaxID=342808 RepID=A0ABQ8U238_9EUKA|nr:putative zinc-binding protein [Paratrimastix pyriformis]
MSLSNLEFVRRGFSRLAGMCPVAVAGELLSAVEAYESQREVVLEGLAHVGPLVLDVIQWSLLVRLADPSRPRMKSDGTSLASWLLNLIAFATQLYLKWPHLQLDVTLNFLVNLAQVRAAGAVEGWRCRFLTTTIFLNPTHQQKGLAPEMMLLKSILEQLAEVQLVDDAKDLNTQGSGPLLARRTVWSLDSAGGTAADPRARLDRIDRLKRALLSRDTQPGGDGSTLLQRLLLCLVQQKTLITYGLDTPHIKLIAEMLDKWRNGSVSDFGSEGCGFESHLDRPFFSDHGLFFSCPITFLTASSFMTAVRQHRQTAAKTPPVPCLLPRSRKFHDMILELVSFAEAEIPPTSADTQTPPPTATLPELLAKRTLLPWDVLVQSFPDLDAPTALLITRPALRRAVQELVPYGPACEKQVALLEQQVRRALPGHDWRNISDHSTVEFRIFRGTLKYNTLIATLQMVNRICDVALILSDDELKALSWTSFVSLLSEEEYPELISYLKERRLYINEPVMMEDEI